MIRWRISQQYKLSKINFYNDKTDTNINDTGTVKEGPRYICLVLILIGFTFKMGWGIVEVNRLHYWWFRSLF